MRRSPTVWTDFVTCTYCERSQKFVQFLCQISETVVINSIGPRFLEVLVQIFYHVLVETNDEVVEETFVFAPQVGEIYPRYFLLKTEDFVVRNELWWKEEVERLF